MRSGAGGHAGLGTPGTGYHAAAFLGASMAGFGAHPAVLHLLMPFALLAAEVAYLGTGLANRVDGGAAPGHVADGKTANGSAIDVEADATGEFPGIRLHQAGSGTVITGIRTGVARVDAGLEMFVGHGLLPWERFKERFDAGRRPQRRARMFPGSGYAGPGQNGTEEVPFSWL